MKCLLAASALLALLALPAWGAEPVAIVAAENFYGDVARQIGGAEVSVVSILANPDQDPHLFEASPTVARHISAARIAISNGIDYDPWMANLLRAARGTKRVSIVVGDLVGKRSADNPHIWYDPATMRALAAALAQELGRVDPGHLAGYQQRLAQFQASLQPVDAKLAAQRARLAGIPVTATEPVFGYVFAALGMQVRNLPFQLAVMNNTEPSASDIAAFETDLKTRQVRLLVYNSQASDPIAQRMMALAEASGIPVVGATETEPPGTAYQTWLLGELNAVDRALPPP